MSRFAPRWRLQFFTVGGAPIGEVLDAHDRQLSFNLYNPNTISFRCSLVSPQVANFLTYKEGLILAYRNNKLAMTAEITSIEVTGEDEGSHDFTVTAVETMHTRLQKRLVGKSAAGLKGPTTATDQGKWLQDVLEALNSTANTGLVIWPVTNSANITGGTWRYKPFMELMQEMSATLGGFDFDQIPLDPSSVANRGRTGAIRIRPVAGRARPNAVFEYGTGAANARSYQWLIHDESEINAPYVLPPSFPDSAGLQVAASEDATSINRIGRREETIPSDVGNFTMRKALADLHLFLRKNPREQFTIQPAPSDGSGRVPEFIDDYYVGDMVRGRVQDQGLLHLDAMVRVYGVTVNLNDEGQETIDLTLVNDQAAVT